MLEPVKELISSQPPSLILENLKSVSKAAVSPPKLSKAEIRSSLKASTYDGIFSTIFGCITADVLLSNFLVELGATSAEIGVLLSVSMLANFLQPIGAYLGDRAISRRWYNLQIFSVARLLWLILVWEIMNFNPHLEEGHQLIQWTIAIASATHILGALGCASWVSWMAVLVPQRLRGRYFALRNSVSNLTSLLCAPLLGTIVSNWPGGSIQAYGLVLLLAVLAGITSLSCQLFMADVNPQIPAVATPKLAQLPSAKPLQDKIFLRFLLYNGLWAFAINLGTPFLTIYLLKELHLNVAWVTFYSSLTAGANVLMLMLWGKLSDRLGNRPVLVLVGLVVIVMPLLWLSIGTGKLWLFLGLPLLYLLLGGTNSALDLCNNNLQMALAPARGSSSYFAIAAAVGGLGGALGTTAGGILVELAQNDCQRFLQQIFAPPLGGFAGLFILSVLLRLLALLPLLFVREPHSQSLTALLRNLFPFRSSPC